METTAEITACGAILDSAVSSLQFLKQPKEGAAIQEKGKGQGLAGNRTGCGSLTVTPVMLQLTLRFCWIMLDIEINFQGMDLLFPL